MFKINQYFDGNVASIAFQTATLPATVGVMAVGEYEFGTSQLETITVVSGALTVKLPGSGAWQTLLKCWAAKSWRSTPIKRPVPLNLMSAQIFVTRLTWYRAVSSPPCSTPL